MGEVVEFPQGARTNLDHLSTDELVRLFWAWDGTECDLKGTDCVEGCAIWAIQEEVNRRGEGERVAV